MSMSFAYGADVSDAVLALCCLIGIVVYAKRTRGRTRVFGIVGCALIVLHRLVSIIVLLLPNLGVSAMTPLLVVTTLFETAGLVSLGLSLLPARGTSALGDSGEDRHRHSEVLS